jgi:hypothetical protein
MVLWF